MAARGPWSVEQKESMVRDELKRCTIIERRWNRNEVSCHRVDLQTRNSTDDQPRLESQKQVRSVGQGSLKQSAGKCSLLFLPGIAAL